MIAMMVIRFRRRGDEDPGSTGQAGHRSPGDGRGRYRRLATSLRTSDDDDDDKMTGVKGGHGDTNQNAVGSTADQDDPTDSPGNLIIIIGIV